MKGNAMKFQSFIPDYFPEFSCIAGECRHNCCIGWEIDVDPDTREYYRTVPGEIGARLAENIVDNGETSFFRMGEDERCPFLNRDNLCDLILTLGEESLCQICEEHPRFVNSFAGLWEMGLGLCCEAAGRLILLRKEPVKLICTGEVDSDREPDPEEEYLLSLRDKLTGIAQDRRLSIDARIHALLAEAWRTEIDMTSARWADFLLTLERLDDAWADRLEDLKSIPEATLSSEWDIPFEQLLVYLLYRHIPGALDDGETSARIAYCALICTLLRSMLSADPTEENLIELARLYSSELEYSDENIEKILWEINE